MDTLVVAAPFFHCCHLYATTETTCRVLNAPINLGRSVRLDRTGQDRDATGASPEATRLAVQPGPLGHRCLSVSTRIQSSERLRAPWHCQPPKLVVVSQQLVHGRSSHQRGDNLFHRRRREPRSSANGPKLLRHHLLRVLIASFSGCVTHVHILLFASTSINTTCVSVVVPCPAYRT